MNLNKKNNKNERGAALIAVLSLLLLLAIITASVVTSSQSARFSSATSTQMSNSVYMSESAVARGLWLLINDKTKFTNRTHGQKNNDQPLPVERFIANGSEHRMAIDGVEMSLRITDMFSGINVSGASPAGNFNYMTAALEKNPVRREAFETFKNRLMDYVDTDDLIRQNSMESADYAALDLMPLPRNNQLEYREEILLIPGVEKFFKPDKNGVLSCINIVPPRNMQTVNSLLPHLFSAPEALIQEKCNLDSRDMELVKEALSRSREENIPLDEAFRQQPQLLTRLTAQFSVNESGYYTLQVRPAADAGVAGRTLIVSLKVDQGLPPSGLQYYQWQLY